jgi:arginase
VPTRDPVSLVIEPGGLARMVAATRAAVGTALDSGLLPLVVGGDCPLLLGCLGAVADRAGPPSLLFVDGHEDAYGPAESPTGEAADMELGFLLGRHALPPGVSAPVLDPAAVAILGARDGRPLREDGVATLRGVVPFWDDAALASDPEGMTRRALAAIRQPWWFHVDLDVLSTDALPSVDYPQPGGLGWADLETVARAAIGARPVGVDVTIYNPDLDPDGRDAEQIVRFLGELARQIAHG